jgi:hypothetical protein
MRRRTQGVLLVILLLAMPSVASAQSSSPEQGVRVEVGRSDNHDGRERFIAGAVRRFWAHPGGVTVEAGALAGFPYVGGDLGLEVQFPVAPRVFGVVRGGVGVLFEGEFLGVFVRFGGGLGVQLTDRNAIAVTYQVGNHYGSNQGPHQLMLGWEHRFARK